ncbi:hypothetical protein JOE31_002552 [Arthrobacter sp. PvP023]|uniref:DUF6226 family protein n=1 Tax=Micrococcaceae TaxID=1268 RepID=UPI001AE465E3|nr:DUF6226 family protein [Arthrobacter sp. PvP023]MBP1136320.1 hypothetical protein [Arthrobacter sp. PvP023]
MGSMEDLFDGPATGLPDPIPRGRAVYAEEPGREARVRHVGGYSAFIGFCAGRNVSAEELADDPARLIWFLHAFAAGMEPGSDVSAAAAVFAGNTIARMRPDAEWTASEGGAPLVGNRRTKFEVGRLLEVLPTADDDSVRGLVDKLLDWARETEDPPAARPAPVPPPAGKPRYVRPPLPTTTYYSPEGAPVPYGGRWGADGPDPDSYSVDSHPERFAGLHVVALALIDHLSALYDVDVDSGPAHAAGLQVVARDVLQAIRVTPRRSGAAALTFVLTGYPGVLIRAGLLHDFPFPVCGCDACDDTAETVADRMEMLVLGVAAGGYSERYPVGSRRWSEYALTAVDGSGSESGSGEPGTVDAVRLQEAEVRLRQVAGGWRPWPLRSGR